MLHSLPDCKLSKCYDEKLPTNPNNRENIYVCERASFENVHIFRSQFAYLILLCTIQKVQSNCVGAPGQLPTLPSPKSGPDYGWAKVWGTHQEIWGFGYSMSSDPMDVNMCYYYIQLSFKSDFSTCQWFYDNGKCKVTLMFELQLWCVHELWNATWRTKWYKPLWERSWVACYMYTEEEKKTLSCSWWWFGHVQNVVTTWFSGHFCDAYMQLRRILYK